MHNTTDSSPMIRTQDLSIHFGGLVAVNKVNINLKRGEILGLIGSNGAGKTTTFNMIAGALKPSGGSIFFGNQQIGGLQPHKICKLGIARTYQIVQPFTSLTVLENVMVGSLNNLFSVNNAKEKAKEILSRLDLYKLKDIKGSDLNLPQLKRMEIARAIATEPEVLLLDEVMAGLNPAECEEAMDIVKGLRDSGITIIVIEHVMKAIMNISDRIYVMDHGKIIAEGSPKQIATNEEVIEAYLGGDTDVDFG